MKITQVLLGEHGAMYPLLDLIERVAPSASLDSIRVQARFLQSTLSTHAWIEDTVLRPAIQQHLPPRAMRMDGSHEPTDHEIIDAGLCAALDAQDAESARRLLLDTVEKTRKHFEKEERLIFCIAERELSHDVQDCLAQEWAAKRTVFVHNE